MRNYKKKNDFKVPKGKLNLYSRIQCISKQSVSETLQNLKKQEA